MKVFRVFDAELIQHLNKMMSKNLKKPTIEGTVQMNINSRFKPLDKSDFE
jgi:hypothetical protein